jgi:hypothetical protein
MLACTVEPIGPLYVPMLPMTIGVPVADLPVVEPLAAAGPAVPVDAEPELELELELEPHPATTSPAATVAQATINLARENTCLSS